MRMDLRHSGLTVAATMVAALLLASCWTTPPSPAPSTRETGPYGSLKLAVNFHSGTILAPTGIALYTASPFQALGAPIFDSLVELTPDGQPRPGIAERWEISPDGKTHTFFIRKGVKFHDGSDLAGADVKFSVDSFVAPDNTGPDAPAWRAQVARVELREDYTVAIQMKQPQFELLKGFLELSGGPAVLPKKYIEEKGFDYFAANLVGSGPWKVVSFVPNSRLELEALSNHWRAVPKFKNVTLLYIPEESTRIAMLKTGELDIAGEVSPDSVPGLKSAGLRTLNHYGGSQFYANIYYDLADPRKYALGDVRVRKALLLAIDRKELAGEIYGGFAEPSYAFYVPTTAFFFDPNLFKPDPFDAEQAKRLLSEAGYPNGFSTKVWDRGGGSMVSTLDQALAGYWRKVGVGATVQTIEFAAIRTMTSPKVSPEMFNSINPYISGGGVFHFERMVTAYHSTQGSFKNLKVPRLDELIEKVPLTTNPDEKKRMAQEAAVLAKNEYSTLGILDVSTIFAVGANVGELTPVKGLTALGPSLETITHAK